MNLFEMMWDKFISLKENVKRNHEFYSGQTGFLINLFIFTEKLSLKL